MKNGTLSISAADGGTFSAYLAEPDGETKRGVVVLQEIFGINANIRAVCEWLASEGFAAAAPDLFWRQRAGVDLDPGDATDREQATALMKAADPALAVSDALATAERLRARLGDGARIATVGFCFGGKLAYLTAMRPEIAAAVSYYGVAIQASLDRAEAIVRPLLLHIAAEDHLCPPEAQLAIRQAMADRHELVTILDYAGVGHAFARRGGAASYVADSAARADAATIAFLDEHLPK